jgi:hypothetical protein
MELHGDIIIVGEGLPKAFEWKANFIMLHLL